jgi:hypothetical protein
LASKPGVTASGSTYIHVEYVPYSSNFKLKKQVELTTALPKELDSAMEEVEFQQEKYEEAIGLTSFIESLSNRYTTM